MWLIYALLASIMWGLSYSLAERVLQQAIAPFTLLAFQMFFGAVFYISLGLGSQLKTDLATLCANSSLRWLVLFATLVFSLGNLFIALSIRSKNATLAALIEVCYPIFTVLFTWFLFKVNHLTPGVIAGSILIFVGVLLIYYFS